jgi:CSLREA domain-containing protein
MGFRRNLAAASGSALGATVMFAPGAEAATFTVTTLADTDDATCDAACSLRDAATVANATAGYDTIAFASGLSGTITLTSQIFIEEQANVTGPGADVLTVSGADASRIFYVDPGDAGAANDPVTISGLTLADGFHDNLAGALYSNEADLTLDGMVFANNETDFGGGALYLDGGSLTVSDSVFSGNVAGRDGGAIHVPNTNGTPADDDVEVLIQDSAFLGNRAARDGGALHLGSYASPGGDVLIERTTLSANEAADEGGAIHFRDFGDGGEDLRIASSTISGNTAGRGGGVYIDSVQGSTTIENTTISGNSAVYDGGGAYLLYLNEERPTTIRNSTVVGNVASLSPGPGTWRGGGIYLYDESPLLDQFNGPLTVSSTIVAGNTADAGPDLGEGNYADGFEVGFSLIGDPAGATITETPAGSNLLGVDPLLGPLAANGGPTETHLPAVASPAIDRGIATGPSGEALAADQRGLGRTGDVSAIANAPGDGTDVGAVELQVAGCQGASVPSIAGTDGADKLTGTAGADAISALGGRDKANARGGKDCVSGGTGKDKLKGGGGKDKLAGGGGKDKLNGGPGKDKLKPGGGRDKVNCGGGKDKVNADPKDRVAANCERVT